MAYEVPPLPYPYDALEPHIDEATMRLHHDKHHQAYVDKANGALEGTDLDGKPIEEVLADLNQVPEAKRGVVRNNGGGHYNHTLFWDIMGPDGGGEPDGALREAIDSAFGSFDDFKTKIKEAGVGQFGSGWAWLVHDGSGLAVVATPNQDTPLSQGQTPLLGVDVWEHAYYLKYQNKRPDYIDAWWNVVDWSKVAQRYSAVA
jgi:Fe-Mn family superoxide dismutase